MITPGKPFSPGGHFLLVLIVPIGFSIPGLNLPVLLLFAAAAAATYVYISRRFSVSRHGDVMFVPMFWPFWMSETAAMLT